MIQPVPPLTDHRLEAWLNDFRSAFNSLKTSVESSGSKDGLPSVGGDSSNLPVYVTPVELVDEGSGTENAWTNISAGAPVGTQFALVVINMSGGTALAKFRKASGEPEIDVQSGADTRHSVIAEIPLASDGTFDYFVDTAMVTWSFVYIGYLGVPA